MIIFSDLHLKVETAEVVFGKVLPGIYQAAVRECDGVIACLGDVFHLRYRVEVCLLNQLRDCFRGWLSGGSVDQIILLPGNHDQVDVAGRNALETLGDIDGVEVYTEPTKDMWGWWLPYRKRREDIKQALRNYPPTGVVFCHAGIVGSWMNENCQNTDGIPVDWFGEAGLVLCGHYHKHHSIQNGRITYVGSPYQTQDSESGQPKGWCRWDTKNLTFHEERWGPRYHRITLQPGEKLDTSDFVEGDDVRVSTAVGVDPKKIGKQLQKLGVQHTVTPELEVIESRLQVSESASLEEYAQAYVSTVNTELDAKRLLSIYRELIS